MGKNACQSDFRQHTGKDFQSQILLVAQSVCAALDDANFVVETLDEAERDLVFRIAVGSDPLPMTLDHFRELLVRLEALPLEAGFPVVEEAPRPTLALVAPQLAEGFLQDVGGMESLVGGQQGLQGLSAIERQVFVVAQQDILLALDVAPLFARQPGVLGLAHLVERIVEMAHDVKLVEQDGGLGRSFGGGIVERLPHIHDRQTDAACLLLAQPVVELVHAGFRTILAAEPDRSTPNQVAHHDAVGVPLANRNLVDADRLRTGRASPLQLRLHVLLVEFLDGLPVQMQFLGNILDGAAPAASPDEPGKPLRVERVVCKKVELLALHLAAISTEDSPDFQFQIDARVATGQIPYSSCRSVVPANVRPTALLADCFFERRTNVMTRAAESPKTPRTSSRGRKPANRYASRRRLYLRRVAIAESCQFPRHCQSAKTSLQQGIPAV